MGKHERLAFDLLASAFRGRFVRDDTRIFSFGLDAGTGEVDWTMDGRGGVEDGVGGRRAYEVPIRRRRWSDLYLHA